MKKLRSSLTYRTRLVDLLVVIGLVLIAVLISTHFQSNFLFSTLLFFGLPSIFLIFRKPSNFKKTFVGALLLGVIWGFSFDYFAEFNHAWGWATNTSLAFPIQFFGVVSLDIMIWYFLWIFFIISFYEYFVEYDFSKNISKRAPMAAVVGVIVAIIIIFISKVAPSLLLFHFPYLILGFLTLIPLVYIVLRRPKLFPKILEIVPFFIFAFLSFELTALHLQIWGFPGVYIGNVNLIGETFPFEEMLFWIVASSAVAASYYEYCIDDEK